MGRYEEVAVLHAYFDESGTHAQHRDPVTFVAGFVGTSRQWRNVRRAWTTAMKGETFHYKEFRMEGELLAELTEILASSGLQVVSAGFTGNWERAISAGPDWKRRFPSCYSMVFEMSVEQMNRWCRQLWGGEPIAITFSRQLEYGKRAEEIWRTFRGNGEWRNLVSFAYGDPEVFPQLQAADMIAHETYQCLKVGNDEVWQKWPLVRRLLVDGVRLVGGYHTEESFVEMMRKGDREGRTFLKTVPRV
jgi:hypothetical protein